MFFYNLRLGWQSLLRTPVLTLLALATIALGIAGATTFVTTYHLLSADPLPHKSDRISYVRLDNWNPERAFDDDHPERAPNQVTWRDAVALLESGIPARTTATYEARLFVHPERQGERPFEAEARMCTRDFFAIFELPFAHGGAWSAGADRESEPVVVLDAATNARLFGGGDSVGRKLLIGERTFSVVGVLAPWRPALKFYDVSSGSQRPPEQIYLPLLLGREMEVDTAGNTTSWNGWEGGFAGKLASDAIWLQLWAELDDAEQQQAFQAHVDAHALAERRLGRLIEIRPLAEVRAHTLLVRSAVVMLLGVLIALLVFVTVVGIAGVTSFSVAQRSRQIGTRRALGATREAIARYFLVEAGIVTGVGIAAGVVLAYGLNFALLEVANVARLEGWLVGAGGAFFLVLGLAAALAPALRGARVAPVLATRAG